jgi:hypothetical protein
MFHSVASHEEMLREPHKLDPLQFMDVIREMDMLRLVKPRWVAATIMKHILWVISIHREAS